MKPILISIALLFSLQLMAGVENPIVQSLPGTVFVPYPGNTAVNPTLPVNQITTPAPFVPYVAGALWSTNNGFALKSVTNLVKLFSDPNSTTIINFDYELEVPVEITYFRDGIVPPVVVTEKLRINFHPNPTAQREYIHTDAFRFTGGCLVAVKILTAGVVGRRLNNTPLTPSEMQLLAKTVFIESEIVVERYYDFNVTNASTMLCPADFAGTVSLPASNELEVKWTPISGAEEYDLEWIFIDDYDGAGGYRSPALLRYDFRQNAARVQVKGNSYRIPLVYEHGYLLFRVRGIGRSPADAFKSPAPGRWSCGDIGCAPGCLTETGVVAGFANRYYIYLPHEADRKNWQVVTAYAENGKRKDVVSYYDGTMRNRQSVTGLNTERHTIVGETIYDHQGRPAIQALPAPVNNAALKYYANFNQNMAGQPYSRLDFDITGPGCANDAVPMRPNNTGAAHYYSAFNPAQSGFNAFIPDAEGYPFSHTEYTPDNTGRIARQGGVGPVHQLNRSRESKYFYGTPHQEELDQLFGNEAGHAVHYKKNMVIDPNGQISLSYLDAKGNTIATALAGNPPANMLPLSSYKAVPFTVDLLAHNHKDLDDYALVMQHTELVNTQSDYVFTYSMLPMVFDYTACDDRKYCLDCVYDLEFQVIDNLNCSKVVYENRHTIGTPFVPDRRGKSALLCNPLDPSPLWMNLPPFTVNLSPGSYTFIKRLIVNEAAADAYVAAVLDTCPKLYEQLLLEQYALIDTTGCDIDCDDALADKNDAAYYAGLSQEEKDELDALIEDLCESGPVSSCQAAYAAMLADVSPGGQYGYLPPSVGTADPLELSVSVFWPSNKLNNAVGNPHYLNSSIVFLDALGAPVAKNPLEDFVAQWRPEWAEQLVVFHPEYCYYQFCKTHLEASDKYTATLMGTETYADAQAAGFTSALNIMTNDPFFNPVNVTFNALLPGYSGLMTTAIGNFKSSGLSIERLALKAATYPAATSPSNWAAATPDQRDKAWPIYRSLYLSYKEELYYRIRSEYAIDNNCYNECIGASNFNPTLNNFWTGSSAPGNNFIIDTDQINCDLVMTIYMLKKTKRFPSIYNILPDGFPFDFFNHDPNVVFDYLYNHYNQIKQEICCDSIFAELPKFLYALYSSGKPNFTLNLAATNTFPDNIEGALLGNNSMLAGTFTQSGGVYSVSFPTGPNRPPSPCQQLKFKFLSSFTGTITGFCCYEEIPAGTAFPGPGIHFLMTASTSTGGKVKVEGIYSEDCPFGCPPPPLQCEQFGVQQDLLYLFNYLIYQKRFRNGTTFIQPDYVGADLTPAFGSNAGNFIWIAPSGNASNFTVNFRRGTKICPITFTQPAGLNWLQVQQALPLEPDMSQMDALGQVKAFRLPLKLAGGSIVYLTGSSPCFTLTDCCMPTEECLPCPLIGLPNPKPGTILAEIGPADCDPPCEGEEGFSMPMINPCVKQLIDMAEHNAQVKYEEIMLEIRAEMKEQYMRRCLEAGEKFSVRFTDARHHFTLYYYDQANTLVETVPPVGVAPLSAAQMAQAANFRKGMTPTPVYANHQMVSRYRYNSLNQLTWQLIPDHTAATRFWYDRLGRLIASQNARQATQQYSYTRYDALGRITEVGQIRRTTPPPAGSAYTDASWDAWLNTPDRDQITRTAYDVPDIPSVQALFPGGKQENLRGRVRGITWQPAPTAGGAQIAQIWYSYDIHGNVKTLVQRSFTLTPKVVEYEYDLVSGNVNALAYQRNQPDQYLHRYAYDADNRLTKVETSPDGVLWDTEARYHYYLHGPLARVETGNDQVQGLDYAYTLHGWIKGMNSGSLQAQHDMGKDGQNASPGNFARDAVGFLLGYYDGEYKAISAGATFEPAYAGSNLNASATAPSLYNGNIRHMVTAIQPFMAGQIPMATLYRYDQLNRLRAMQAEVQNFNPGANQWLPGPADDRWRNTFTYDANGNILNQLRNGNAPLAMDNMGYQYYPGTNKLRRVADPVPAANYPDDIDNQTSSNNYVYDATGNLTRDAAEGLTIEWNLQNKVAKVTDISPAKTITFGYNPLGNRVLKRVDDQSTFYTYDATGNVLAIYRHSNSGGWVWESAMLYGNKRLGEYRADKCLTAACSPAALPANHFYRYRGKRQYEMTNHLGNVLATVSDRKLPRDNGSGTATHFEADVATAQDYYPFGMLMPGRFLPVGGGGRFGFQGQEMDNEVKGVGNHLSFMDYGYDPRLVKRWNIDPRFKEYPHQSPYSAFNGNPILYADPTGEGGEISNVQGNPTDGYTADLTVNIFLYSDKSVNLEAVKAQTQGALRERFSSQELYGNVRKPEGPKKNSQVKAKLNVTFNVQVIENYNEAVNKIHGNKSQANNFIYVDDNTGDAGGAAKGNSGYFGGGITDFAITHEVLHLLDYKPNSDAPVGSHSDDPNSIIHGRRTDQNNNSVVTQTEANKLNGGKLLDQNKRPGGTKATFGSGTTNKVVNKNDSDPSKVILD